MYIHITIYILSNSFWGVDPNSHHGHRFYFNISMVKRLLFAILPNIILVYVQALLGLC